VPSSPSKMLAARTALKALLAAAMTALYPGGMPAGWPEAPRVRDIDESPSDTPAGGEIVMERGRTVPTPVEFGQGNGAVFEHRMTVPLALYANHDDPTVQTQAFDAMLKGVGAAIAADESLGGVVDTCEFTESENDQLGGEGNPGGEGSLVSLDLVWHGPPFG